MNEIIHGCLVARPCIILYLSFKLRCYTRISTVTCLSRYLVRLMNERLSLRHSQSMIVLSEFFRSIAVKVLKNPYRQWRSKFARRGGKPKFKITEKFLYWKLGPHFVSVVIQRMFSSWVRQRILWFLFVVSILSFSFINKVDFSRQ